METSLSASRLSDIPSLKRLIDNWPKTAADAEAQRSAYMFTLHQAVHVFRFMRWEENPTDAMQDCAVRLRHEARLTAATSEAERRQMQEDIMRVLSVDQPAG